MKSEKLSWLRNVAPASSIEDDKIHVASIGLNFRIETHDGNKSEIYNYGDAITFSTGMRTQEIVKTIRDLADRVEKNCLEDSKK